MLVGWTGLQDGWDGKRVIVVPLSAITFELREMVSTLLSHSSRIVVRL